MSRTLTLALAALALAPGARAEQGAAPPVFGADLDLVNLTVTVVDKNDRPVTDLSAADFVVREDGRPQKLQLFARALEAGERDVLALDLGLLLDTSESMLSELKLSQEAALRFLDAVPRARDLITVFFDQDIRLSRYDSESQQGLIERIVDSRGGGTTALYDAIAVYLSRVQDASGRKVLVLFTDGEDSVSRLSRGEALDLARSSGVTIYSIGFTGGFSPGSQREMSSRMFLVQLAELTGGRVFNPHTSKDLPSIYQRILDELAGQYVIGFASDGRADGRYRKLKVELKRKDLKVRHREGYYAPAGAIATRP